MEKSENGLSNVSLVLHDIRSVLNVGAIFRTAEAFGVEEIILSGYTPGPIDRFGRTRNDFHKAALGAENSIPWQRLETAEGVLQMLEGRGARILSLEQAENSIDLRDLPRLGLSKAKIALVPGNEVNGVDPVFIKNSDRILEIPMFGKKESLNVTSATAIALYALLLGN